MRKINGLVLIPLLSLLGSCSKDNSTGNLYVPTAADTTATATLEQLQQGRASYIDNCESCHNLYSPDDFSVSSWGSIMYSMAPKTGMNSSEVSLVKKYVTRGQ